MNILGVIMIAIGVAMDAFAIALCKGVTIKSKTTKTALIIGFWFGVFQGAMPLLGYFFMDVMETYIMGIKDIIIFLLLAYIGVMMILESRKEEQFNDSLSFKEMFGLSIATSLDALSIGATLSIYNINVFIIVSIIAIITFVFSFLAVKIGNKFGDKYKSKAEIMGGVILIIIGLKVLLEYLI